MASSKKYLEFVLEQLADLEEISYRAMMSEYILYYKGRILGGIYDNRLPNLDFQKYPFEWKFSKISVIMDIKR
ncbi:TfoX domain family protein [Streptococcus massiliensis]|uniref:TfoX domain family protein n=1 Tax=Streptococcus massiliensis TaxID=313439 RepID=A0A380KY00_9STRE|nr:TfoX domain family protein [Streptococcus massiliensis]